LIGGVVHGGDRRHAEIRVQLVVRFGAILKKVTVPDRAVANVAREQHALGCMDDDPAGHRIPDRGVLDEGTGRHLTRHVEMNRVVANSSALTQMVKLNSLDLHLLEALPDNDMAAKDITRII